MTELTWQGKYNKDGKKNAPLRIALPFQTIETVNESAQERQQNFDLFAQGKPTEWRNRLIWGDKKYVLPALLPEFAGKINLIYIDPPFDTGADFSFTAKIPPHNPTESATAFVKQPSLIEQKAYRDTWGKGLDSYLQWFYETALLLRELLAEDGSIYVHLDWHVGHYVKCVLDDVFGYESFLNEVVWFYKTGGASKDKWARKHDNIFFYAKKEGTQLFNLQTEKSYMMHNYGFKKSDFKIDKETGLQYSMVYCRDVWEIPSVGSATSERVDYATQKPETLLERIIKASSNKGDLILDCFCGSGTTAAVAEKLERRWIACDLGRFAIHTTRKRLLSNPDVKPFIVQNLGKYERQHWMNSEFTNPQNRLTQEKNYRQFILNLYHADKIDGYTWLHGIKKGRMVHIGSVDAPVALGDVKNTVQELWKKGGKNGLDILGWEFAFELNETAKQLAVENKVDLKFKKIPREVLDKRAVDQGDISFFELAALDVSAQVNKKHQRLTLTLNNFIVLPDDIPKDVMQAISHWSQWIDYWAVDFNYHDDTFHNEWQSYRTKKKPEIGLSVAHYYQEKGSYTVVVKVIDILGNDTTKLLEIIVQ